MYVFSLLKIEMSYSLSSTNLLSGLLSCDSSLLEVKQLDQLWSKVAGTEIRLESLYWPPFERKTSKTIFSWKFKRDRFAMPSFVDVQVDGQNFRVRGPAPALINDANENIRTSF